MFSQYIILYSSNPEEEGENIIRDMKFFIDGRKKKMIPQLKMWEIFLD